MCGRHMMLCLGWVQSIFPLISMEKVGVFDRLPLPFCNQFLGCLGVVPKSWNRPFYWFCVQGSWGETAAEIHVMYVRFMYVCITGYVIIM